MNYFWVRVFDYNYERDLHDKGILLDEFYLKGETLTRDEAKQQVKEKYSGKTARELLFSKPKKQTNGVYAIVMDSEKFFWDRFYLEIDTFCFKCHKSIKGMMRDFPRTSIGDDETEVYFCSYDCRGQYYKSLKFEGDFQEKEAGQDGGIFGYIYHIYNRTSNIHYIGQTRYMPFFRWQEHVKAGEKGKIEDLTFDTITEVRRNNRQSDDQNQQYLNSIEAWWIAKFKEEGYEVFNISNPKITIEYLKDRFNEMVAQQKRLDLIIEEKVSA
ncbi:MAG: hypothetical protein GXY86_08800 [Firmicutes bacterium]|mgnify:CR=1 FL=1|nr:hypothetical protein [Bacillota bacterium]